MKKKWREEEERRRRRGNTATEMTGEFVERYV